MGIFLRDYTCELTTSETSQRHWVDLVSPLERTPDVSWEDRLFEPSILTAIIYSTTHYPDIFHCHPTSNLQRPSRPCSYTSHNRDISLPATKPALSQASESRSTYHKPKSTPFHVSAAFACMNFLDAAFQRPRNHVYILPVSDVHITCCAMNMNITSILDWMNMIDQRSKDLMNDVE